MENPNDSIIDDTEVATENIIDDTEAAPENIIDDTEVAPESIIDNTEVVKDSIIGLSESSWLENINLAFGVIDRRDDQFLSIDPSIG